MKEINENLLVEYLEGKLDEPTCREIESWYDSSEENRHQLERLYFILFAGERLKVLTAVNPDSAFRSLQRRVDLRRGSRSRWQRTLLRYAAILIVGLFVAGTYIYQQAHENRICSVYAERMDCTVILPDGSSVKLAQHSRLDYPAGMDNKNKNRTVHLVGEGFFEVCKTGHPFTVTTEQQVQVIVRGTKFNLKAYTDHSDIETVLVEGAVDFRAADQVVSLKPGQKVSYNPADKELTVLTVDPGVELENRFRTFRGVPLSQIVGVIEQFYNLDVAFREETIGNVLFTGTLDFDLSVDAVLEILTLATDSRFSATADGIVIYR